MIKDEIADQLVYSTVRIVCRDATSISRGTGFFMIKEYSPESNIIAIVTNNHVVEGYNDAEFTLCTAEADGTPNNLSHVTIKVTDLQKRTIPHFDKNVDICLVFINDKISEIKKEGIVPYYKCVGTQMSLQEQDYDSLTSIEDIIMIGYPKALIDEYNNKPVVRKGITATSIKLNYQEQADFLIDIACFHGSSGSPVFLRKEGLRKEASESGITLGLAPSYSLLGIVHSAFFYKENGEIVSKSVPTVDKQVAELRIPLNIGQVTKTEKIIEIFDFVNARRTG